MAAQAWSKYLCLISFRVGMCYLSLARTSVGIACRRLVDEPEHGTGTGSEEGEVKPD